METPSILIDMLPEYITVHGDIYQINADFRTCLKIIMAFEDNELTPQEKQIILINNLYRETPPDIVEALRQANTFLNGGDIQEENEETPFRLYSFTKDARFIYSAFRQTHGIDLTESDLHWWQFTQLIGLRKRIKTGKASKEERAAAREMGEAFEVPEIDRRTLEEKEAEAEFMRLIGK
jgi:hypothetical protein